MFVLTVLALCGSVPKELASLFCKTTVNGRGPTLSVVCLTERAQSLGQIKSSRSDTLARHSTQKPTFRLFSREPVNHMDGHNLGTFGDEGGHQGMTTLPRSLRTTSFDQLTDFLFWRWVFWQMRRLKGTVSKLQEICLKEIAEALQSPKGKTVHQLPLPTREKRRLHRWMIAESYVEQCETIYE